MSRIKAFALLVMVLVSSSIYVINFEVSITRITSLLQTLHIRTEPVAGEATQGEEEGCVQSQIRPWHPDVLKYLRKLHPLDCGNQKDWFFVERGVLRAVPQIVSEYGDLHCNYTPVTRGNHDNAFAVGKVIQNVTSGFKIPSDFFVLDCLAASGRNYSNLHAGIHYSSKLHEQLHDLKLARGGRQQMNVLIIAFDSVSSMAWQRRLPKTHEYFLNTLGGVDFPAYNTIGGYTTINVMPLFSGLEEHHIVNFYRNKELDEVPWVWKDFEQAGYVTQNSEDFYKHVAYNSAFRGFQVRPYHHYMRPYMMKGGMNTDCVGGTPKHRVVFRWCEDFFDMYDSFPRFSHLWSNELTHQDPYKLGWVDGDLLSFLKSLKRKGHLENTAIVFLSDHGNRYNPLRSKTEQGKYELLLPYLGVYLPPVYVKRHPDRHSNMLGNAKSLLTARDLFATLKDFVNYSEDRFADPTGEFISLLKKIPISRTCKSAGLRSEWCACENWKEGEKNTPLVRQAVNMSLRWINETLSPVKHLCEHLTLNEVTGYRYSERRNPVLTMQIKFTTKPNNGLYEFNVEHLSINNSFVLRGGRPYNRMDKYGQQADCIAKIRADLKEICLCRDYVVPKPKVQVLKSAKKN